jgi:hypothetical protein
MRNGCGCTGAGCPAAPYREERSVSTWTSARSEAALTIAHPWTRLIARKPPSGPCFREKNAGACSARRCSLAHTSSAPGEVGLPGRQEDAFDDQARILEVGQHQVVAPDVHRSQRQDSETRAPVAHSVRRRRRSRSVCAAAITARTSSEETPSGGCQCLVADLTELVGPHSGELLGRLRRLGFWGVLLSRRT